MTEPRPQPLDDQSIETQIAFVTAGAVHQLGMAQTSLADVNDLMDADIVDAIKYTGFALDCLKRLQDLRS